MKIVIIWYIVGYLCFVYWNLKFTVSKHEVGRRRFAYPWSYGLYAAIYGPLFYIMGKAEKDGEVYDKPTSNW